MELKKNRYIVNLSVLLTLALFGLASLCPLESMWGFNHLHFLPDMYAYVYWAVVAAVVYLMVGRLPHRLLDRTIGRIDSWLWGKQLWPRLLFAAACSALFYLFRVETHLLGDGYTWLAIFGHGESYIHKWAEPGSIFLLRQIQSLIGGYTRETALLAFQILSIASGVVVVYSFLTIVGQLCSNVYARVLGLSSVLLSGAILMFFGYVEFYPVSWAACVVFLSLSIKSLREGRLLWAVLIAYLIAVLMHLQALYFLPGLAYLVIQKTKQPRLRRLGYILFGVGALAGVALFVWLYSSKVEFERLLLPLFEGRPVAPDYTVLSWPHLFDLTNEVLLVFPGGLVLLVLWLTQADRVRKGAISVLLTIWSAGSLMFLLLFGAAITMA